MKTRHLLLLLALVALAIASCGGSDDALSPPEIRYGEDVCDHCNMIISEPRFAAAYSTTAGDTRRFDDIGEMFLYAHERGEEVRAFWVHDYHSEAWVEAAQATFVHDPQVTTPMGWSILAFGAEGDAQSYAQGAGVETLTFSELQELVQHGDLAPEGMARHNHDH